jgi:hypothetical protein
MALYIRPKFQVELLREDLFQLLRPAVDGISVLSGALPLIRFIQAPARA